MILLHETAIISALADIEDSIKGSIISIGAETRIDSFVKIKPAGGRADCVIGEQCYINSGVVIYTGNGIQIGDKVLIASNCTLAPVNHGTRELEKAFLDQPFGKSKGGIVIEDNVWIGANSVVLDGAVIRSGTVVAAGSVVRGELLGYSIYAGNPAKFVRPR